MDCVVGSCEASTVFIPWPLRQYELIYRNGPRLSSRYELVFVGVGSVAPPLYPRDAYMEGCSAMGLPQFTHLLVDADSFWPGAA